MLVLAVLVASGLRCAAEAPGDGVFNSAYQVYSIGYYGPAEQDFAAFIRQYTNSSFLPKAVYYMAQCRMEQTNYDGAISLLSSHLARAGDYGDDDLLLIAQAYEAKGDYRSASQAYAKLIKDYPISPYRLQAAIGEATDQSTLAQWPKVLEALQRTNSAFLDAVRSNATNEWAQRGYILLSEAHFALEHFASAAKALEPLARLQMKPELAWHRQYLLCRIALAQGHPEEAMRNATNLAALATSAGRPLFEAESLALQADLFDRLGNTQQAFKAADALDQLCARYQDRSVGDAALLTLGELRLHQSQSSTNATLAAKYLQRAAEVLQALTRQFPKSPLRGKAQLDLGWCFWFEHKLSESQAAFQRATATLPPSTERVLAQFKLADVEYRLTNYLGALSNYYGVVAQSAALPRIKTSLVEPALYQAVRAALAAGEPVRATDALSQLLRDYPKGYLVDAAVLLTGQAVNADNNPVGAREIFQRFLKACPTTSLLPKVELAIALTYEQQAQWTQAIRIYDRWLATFAHSPAWASVLYYRAMARYQAGANTSALGDFNLLLSKFPKSKFAPLAAWWIADYSYYFSSTNLPAVEKNYKRIYQNPDWAHLPIAYEAKMMTGRAAVQSGTDQNTARECFTELYRDTNCPTHLRAQALFAYGCYYMTLDSTNKLADYQEALRILDRVTQEFPKDQVAVLALGEKANCLLQLAQVSHQYDTNAFEKVITSPLADFTARSAARVGLGAVYEKMADEPKNQALRATLLNLALTSYLNVFCYEKDLRPDERPDLFWVKRAGLDAANLSERLGQWTQAINVYSQLQNLMPSLRAFFGKKIQRARENLARAKSNPA
jgi:TolA-binding protein